MSGSERYTVEMHRVAWEDAETSAVLAAWVEAREMGLSVAQSDRIALAAIRSVRESVGRRARDLAAG